MAGDNQRAPIAVLPHGPSAGWPVEPCAFGQLRMHQQFWCWGQDSRCDAGNLLVSSGFERSRPPDRSMGSTCYILRLPPAGRLWLWGFGVVYEECRCGAIYLNRYSFRPVYSAQPFNKGGVWRPEQVVKFFAPESAAKSRSATTLTRSLLVWIASYEEGVLRGQGLSYRRATLAKWHEPSILPERVPEEWRKLARCAGQIVDPHGGNCSPDSVDASLVPEGQRL